METNKILHQQIITIVDNQIREENPPETKQTFERLIKSGYSKTDAKKYIGQCVAVELFHVMKHHQPFDEKRYVQNLLNLPKEPFGQSV
jgi:hypothetical protein